MKLLKRLRKNHCFRRTLIYFLTCCMVFFNIPLSVARAAPALPDVQMGSIDAAGNTHVLGPESHLYTSNGTVIQWDGGFNIAGGESVEFHQYTDGVLSADSAVLNRILTGSQTVIDGMLQGNGRVFVVNPAGIIFGGGASVNVAQLVASTLNISNSDFQAGHYEFSAVGDSLGEVINNGTITTSEGAALIAKKVLNNGTIVSGTGGFVAMTAGDRVLLGEPGSNIIVEMDSVADGTGTVTNEGTIDAPAGEVVLAAGDIYSTAMSVSGGAGKVEQDGEIHVDGATGDAGSVTLTAADEVSLGPDSLTTANADTVGDGGDIVAYSPGAALFEEGASVEAKGGSEAGNGGFFELSGKEYVEVLGSIDMSASAGQNGAFLLDPYNLTIVAGTGSSNLVGADDVYEPSEGHATLGIDTLEGYLGTADVTLSTFANLGEGPEDGGDIIFAGGELNSGIDPLTEKFTDNSLYVRAYDDIVFEKGSGINFEGNGDVELYAGVPWGDLEGSGDGSVTSVDRGKTPNIWTRAGDIIIDASGGGIDLGSLQAGVETTPGDGSGDDTVFNLRPGELRLTTIEDGDITLQHLNVEGKRYGSVYVNSSGNLTINGDPSFGGAVQVRTNTTSEDGDSASFICLLADKDVTITGDVLAYAKGTRESVAGVWIGAGTQTQEGGTPGTVTLNDKVTADASASGAQTSDATIRIYGETIVWPTNTSKYPLAKTQGSVSYSGITSDYRESTDPEPVYYEVDEYGRVVEDENGDPVIVENPVPLLEKKLGIGYRAAIEIDYSKDSTCLECVNKIRLFLPVAVDDSWEQSKNLEIIVKVLLDNGYGYDYDPERGNLIDNDGTIILVSDKSANASGQTESNLFLINGDTEVAYMPPDGWEGGFVNGEYTDTFQYYAVDADADISDNIATVTITLINQLPVANDNSYNESHNVELTADEATGAIQGTLNGAFADYDPDNEIPEIVRWDILTVEPIVGQTTTNGGTVTLDAEGSFTYTPSQDNKTGTDSFTYTLLDGFGGEDTATVTINLSNDNPVAYDNSYNESHNVELTADEATGAIKGTLNGALEDYDPDNKLAGLVFEDALTVEPIVGQTTTNGGTVTLDAEGSFTYTPSQDNKTGTDSFTYTLLDDFGGEATATVTINLTNTAPVAQPDTYDVSHNATLDLTLPGSPADVITGVNPENRDSDADNSIEGRVFDDTLTSFLPGGLSSGQTSAGGTVELNPDGTFIYTPPDGFNGTDSFEYYVTDSYDNSTVVEVRIAVGLPEIPPPPLPDPIVWEVGGCPALMEWLADELGVEPENVQHYGLSAVSDSQNAVGTKTSIAYKGDMQLCQLCAQLKDSTQVLTDPNGVRMSALTSIIAQAGPLTGPPSPEQMDAIAAALAAAAEDTQYASAREFVEAVVTYVTTLTDKLGYDVADAVALFMEKHGAPITEDEGVDLYIGVLLSDIQAQLEATGG